MKAFLCLIFLSISWPLFSQNRFQNTYKGNGITFCRSVVQTSSGGYIMADDIPGPSANGVLTEVDSSGNIVWSNAYGAPGLYGEQLWAVEKTYDGGYVSCGRTNGFNGGGAYDIFLVKTDGGGFMVWSKTFGVAGKDEYAYELRETTDKGFILAGIASSNPGLSSYLIKTSSDGALLWAKTYKGSYALGATGDYGFSVQETFDQGYVLAGNRNYMSGPGDGYLTKVDNSGTVLWSKTYGSTLGNEDARCVRRTQDGGFIMAGHTTSFGAGGSDFYIVRTNSNGDKVWSKTYGGTADEIATSIDETAYDGYIICGRSKSFSAGDDDTYLVKIDSVGKFLWSATYGETGYDIGNSVIQTMDGGYMIKALSWTDSLRIMLIKTDSNGDSGCGMNNPVTLKGTPTDTVISTPVAVSTLTITSTPPSVMVSGTALISACSNPVFIVSSDPLEIPVSVFPNPASDLISVNYGPQTKNPHFEIIDLMGRTISVSKEKQIDISELPSGLYLLKVTDGELHFAKRFIKQ